MITRNELIAVNREYRSKDSSHLWPIRDKFSVTERAIRQARYIRREGSECYDATEYRALLDSLESAIVNDERNWWQASPVFSMSTGLLRAGGTERAMQPTRRQEHGNYSLEGRRV